MLYAMCCTMMYYTITILWYAIPWYTMIYYTILWYAILWYTILSLYYDMLLLLSHYTITVLWYTILYHDIPWYTMICYDMLSLYYDVPLPCLMPVTKTDPRPSHTPATNCGRGMRVPESPVCPGKRLSFPAVLCEGPEQCQVHWLLESESVTMFYMMV